MDIQAKISEIVEKVKGDPQLAESFKTDPVKTVEGLIGVDLPDDLIEKITSGVKSAVVSGQVGDLLGGIKKLF